jgi:hypothetical protein
MDNEHNSVVDYNKAISQFKCLKICKTGNKEYIGYLFPQALLLVKVINA